jgi:hypothetical protein
MGLMHFDSTDANDSTAVANATTAINVNAGEMGLDQQGVMKMLGLSMTRDKMMDDIDGITDSEWDKFLTDAINIVDGVGAEITEMIQGKTKLAVEERATSDGSSAITTTTFIEVKEGEPTLVVDGPRHTYILDGKGMAVLRDGDMVGRPAGILVRKANDEIYRSYDDADPNSPEWKYDKGWVNLTEQPVQSPNIIIQNNTKPQELHKYSGYIEGKNHSVRIDSAQPKTVENSTYVHPSEIVGRAPNGRLTSYDSELERYNEYIGQRTIVPSPWKYTDGTGWVLHVAMAERIPTVRDSQQPPTAQSPNQTTTDTEVHTVTPDQKPAVAGTDVGTNAIVDSNIKDTFKLDDQNKPYHVTEDKAVQGGGGYVGYGPAHDAVGFDISKGYSLSDRMITVATAAAKETLNGNPDMELKQKRKIARCAARDAALALYVYEQVRKPSKKIQRDIKSLSRGIAKDLCK